MRRPVFFPTTFMIAYCCTYPCVFLLNRPLFTYYPLHGDFSWGRKVILGAGPGMAWYGLMASAAIVAAVLALLIPEHALERPFRSYLWLFPVAAMGICSFLMRHFFA